MASSTRPLPPTHPLLQKPDNEDDDEDDPDFVPPVDESESEVDSDDEERNVKRQRVSEPPQTADEKARKDAERARLWEEFQASVAAPKPRKAPEPKKLIKIVKKYRFAGEDVTKVEEVPEDSLDAKSWPLWDPVTQSAIPNPAMQGDASNNPISTSFPSSTPTPSSASTTIPTASSSSSVQPIAPPHPPTRPRKTRKSLDSMFATAKVRKLTTLDKSAMDWKSHLESERDMKEDLEANRKGGGYLEKVEFLKRVEERVEEKREEVGSKRRRP